MTLYIRLILITLGLAISNYITYQYVDNKWEVKWQEANVGNLQLTLEAQQTEMQKQQQMLKEKIENEQYYTKKNEELDIAFDELSSSYSLLVQTIDNMPEGGESGGGSLIPTGASEATNKLVFKQLQQWSLRAVKDLSREADALRLSNEMCVKEYNSMMEVVNE